MNYRIELYDTWGRRIAVFNEVPLLEATRRAPDRPDAVRGILPGPLTDVSHGYRVRVYVEDVLFCDAAITRVQPQWGDTKKLILDRFVSFHEVIEIEAERLAREGNTPVARAFSNRPIDEMVRAAINTALGRVHYTVGHTAYPDGAQREYQKFLARKTAANELEIGGIDAGQWVDSSRIDATNAVAKDGDTISGLKVDGGDWPDLRLMLIDAEETSRNSHAIDRHPEVAGWIDAQYDASGYKLAADAAQSYLQGLIDTKGIDFIELNPHQDATGAFDDRVDAFGRYLGLVYGGGECFNAALVEQGHADVFLFDEGAFLVPELELKDFFSYSGPNAASIEPVSASLLAFDAAGGVFDVLTALAYAAGGFVWSVDVHGAVSFRNSADPDRVVFFDPVRHAVALGSDSDNIVNGVFFSGHPLAPGIGKSYFATDSIEEYALRSRGFEYFSISRQEDADKLVEGLLNDLAYPTPAGEVAFLRGDADIRVGDIVELRDGALRRLEREVEGEWIERFDGKLVGRVNAVTHRFQGGSVTTAARLTSPLRSVDNPLAFIVRSQPDADALFQFRLDDAGVGLDLGYHLD